MKKGLPLGFKQLNVAVPEELLLDVKERGSNVKGGMRAIVEEALRMYLKKGTYFLYTNEDEVSAEINELKRGLEYVRQWCISKGMKDIEDLNLAVQEIERNEEVTAISTPHLVDGKGNQSFVNVCRYCGEEFLTLDSSQAFCSAKHKDRYRKS